MTLRISRAAGVIAAVALLAAGCGGSSNSSNTSTSTASAAPAASSASQIEGGSMTAAAPIPSSLHCNDEIVWVNLKTKVYHMKGDEYYGKTAHGEYECQSTAEAKGDHLAGTPGHHTGSQMPQNTVAPSPSYT